MTSSQESADFLLIYGALFLVHTCKSRLEYLNPVVPEGNNYFYNPLSLSQCIERWRLSFLLNDQHYISVNWYGSDSLAILRITDGG